MKKLTIYILLLFSLSLNAQFSNIINNNFFLLGKQYRVNSNGFTHNIDLIKGTLGDSILINWGNNNDTSLVFNGSSQSASITYSSGLFDVYITGDIAEITDLQFRFERIDSLYPDFGVNFDTLRIAGRLFQDNLISYVNDSFGVSWSYLTDASNMLRNCPITVIPDEFGEAWENLNTGAGMFQGGSLDTLPPDFGKTWTAITQAGSMFNSCELTNLPDSFGYNWTNLSGASFLLFFNDITELPDSFGVRWQNMSDARSMLTDNEIDTLPDDFSSNWPALTNCADFLEENNLKILPDSFLAKSSSCTNFDDFLKGNDLQDTIDISHIENLQNLAGFANNPSLKFIMLPTIGFEFSEFDAENCGLIQAGVDSIYSKMDAFYLVNAPTKDLLINTGGGTSSSPTGGASNTNIVSLSNTFTTALKLFTAIIN